MTDEIGAGEGFDPIGPLPNQVTVSPDPGTRISSDGFKLTYAVDLVLKQFKMDEIKDVKSFFRYFKEVLSLSTQIFETCHVRKCIMVLVLIAVVCHFIWNILYLIISLLSSVVGFIIALGSLHFVLSSGKKDAQVDCNPRQNGLVRESN